MRSYKRYTRRKRLLKHIVVVALVFILGLVLLRAVSYIAIQDEIPMINSFNLFRREADTSFGWNLILVNAGKRIVSGGIYRVTEVKIIKN